MHGVGESRRDGPAPDELRDAFAAFSASSARLTEAYEQLQAQVARLSAELAAANGELARRERLTALGEMAARLAHQLRTPLAAALLYVGHLSRPHLAEEDRLRFAGKALQRLQFLERLIADMLAFVRGARGVYSRFAVSELVTEVVQVVEEQVSAAGLHLEVGGQDSPVELVADRQALTAALLSLVENAIQASRPGASIRLAVGGEAGPFVVFRVEDEGEGIPAEARPRLFEPFYTTRAEGSGLGLAIVKQVAEAHGGWVEVQSQLGRGSLFSLYIPRQGVTEGVDGSA
ncbi:MAG: HAMP domain-containing histidine kinase [Thiobacillaceae bacterium]|nr:HAMP domain-containing histidine kinase [Thiobacillaceae bacterium]